MPDDQPRGLSRRTFIELAGAAGVTVGALSVGSAAAEPTASGPATFGPREQQVTLQIAAAGAVFPIPFPDFGEKGPATTRVTAPRLSKAIRRVRPARLEQARAGAAQVVAARLDGVDQPTLLTGLGRLAADDNPQLIALAAIAVATVSTRFDPNDDGPAQRWLAGLHRLQQQAQLPAVARGRAR
jgi:hypothetical protein